MEVEKGMSVVGKISECLESVEAQKKSLSSSVFSLFVEWKGFEEKIASTHTSFQEFVSELESREKQLDSVQESVSQSLEKLEVKRKSIEDRSRDVSEKEQEFKLFYANGLLKLEQKRKDYANEVEFREGKLSEQEINLDGLLGKLEVRRAEIEGMEKSLKERVKEMELKEKVFEEKKKDIESIGRRIDEVDQKEGKMKEREKRVELREKEMDLMFERQRAVESKTKELELMAEDLALKEKDLQLSRDLNENRAKELDMRENQLDTKEKLLDTKEELLDSKEELLNTKENQLDAKVKQLDSRESLLEAKEKELDAKEKQLDLLMKKNEDQLEKEMIEKYKELDLLKMKVEDRTREVELGEREIQSNKELNEKREKELDMRKEQLSRVNSTKEVELEKELIEKSKVLDLWLKKLVEISENVSKEKELQSKEKQLHDNGHRNVPFLKEEALEELTPNQSQNNIHEESLKRKEIHQHKEHSSALHHVSVKEEAPEELVVKSCTNSRSAGKRICEEGRDLQKFLKEHAEDFDSVGDQVLKALQLSKEPAKVVLVAIEGIYATDVRKGKEVIRESTVRSCIFLLEQLTKIPLESPSSVQEQALKLATKWKTNMSTINSSEVLGFLYLLASFNLAFAFSESLLVSSLEIVAQYRQTPELCRRLGLQDKIPELIRELVKKNRLLLAFDYVYEFELVNVFPPAAILKRHVQYSRMEAKKILKRLKFSPATEDKALALEICALKDVIKCIKNHGLHSEYPSDELISRVEFLERQREEASRTSTYATYLEEKQKVDSHPSARKQQHSTKRRRRQRDRLRQDKRRHSEDDVPYMRRSLSPPPRKCPRWVPLEALRSGQSSSQQLVNDFHSDPYNPSLAASRYRDPRVPPSDVNHLGRKYPTPGDGEPVHSGHYAFQYEVDTSFLQPSIPDQGRPFYPVWHKYDDPDLRLIH